MSDKVPWLVKVGGDVLGVQYAASDATREEVEKSVKLLLAVAKPLRSEVLEIAARDAAPEMLALLKEVHTGWHKDGWQKIMDMMMRIEAAIAKAEGKT